MSSSSPVSGGDEAKAIIDDCVYHLLAHNLLFMSIDDDGPTPVANRFNLLADDVDDDSGDEQILPAADDRVRGANRVLSRRRYMYDPFLWQRDLEDERVEEERAAAAVAAAAAPAPAAEVHRRRRRRKRRPEIRSDPPDSSGGAYHHVLVFILICLLCFWWLKLPNAGAVEEAGVHTDQGNLTEGTFFDSSFERGDPIEFELSSGQVIKGWDQGLLGMCVGEKRKLKIPVKLGYGAQGSSPTIRGGRGATLISNTELVQVNGKGSRGEKTDDGGATLTFDTELVQVNGKGSSGEKTDDSKL